MGGENVPDCSHLLLAIASRFMPLSTLLLHWAVHYTFCSHSVSLNESVILWSLTDKQSYHIQSLLLQIVYLAISMFDVTKIEPFDLICMLYLYNAASCRPYKDCPFNSFVSRPSRHSNHCCRVRTWSLLIKCHITGSWLWREMSQIASYKN